MERDASKSLIKPDTRTPKITPQPCDVIQNIKNGLIYKWEKAQAIDQAIILILASEPL